MRLLIVEDEPKLAELMRHNLVASGFAVDLATSRDEAQACLDAAVYDLLLIDRNLPDGDGLALIAEVQKKDPHPAVIAVTARDSAADRIGGLNAGADDYVVKPFDHAELLARIRAVLRRPGQVLGAILGIGNLSFDAGRMAVSVAGRSVDLTRRELMLLEQILRSQGQVVGREKLETALYGFDEEVTPNALEAAMSRLRRKLKEAGAEAEIVTVRGVGYMLDLPAGSHGG